MNRSRRRSKRRPAAATRVSRLTIGLSGATAEIGRLIRRAARRVLIAEGGGRGRLDVAVVDEAEMRRQHRAWMGDGSVTDVLTFDMREERGLPGGKKAGRSNEPIDGQLLVCEAVARRRARAFKTDWRGELALYVVHGCLHLCGYNDCRRRAAAAMHRREDQILCDLEFGPVYSAARANGTAD